jgi:hypothetical protein
LGKIAKAFSKWPVEQVTLPIFFYASWYGNVL